MRIEKVIKQYEDAKIDLERVARMGSSSFMDCSVREDRLVVAKKLLIKCLGKIELDLSKYRVKKSFISSLYFIPFNIYAVC